MATNREMHSQTYLNVHNLVGAVEELPSEIWNVNVRRNGKTVSALQELADAKTLALENKAGIAALTELLKQVITGKEIDYDRIKEGTREILAEEKLEVDITFNGKPEVA